MRDIYYLNDFRLSLAFMSGGQPSPAPAEDMILIASTMQTSPAVVIPLHADYGASSVTAPIDAAYTLPPGILHLRIEVNTPDPAQPDGFRHITYNIPNPDINLTTDPVPAPVGPVIVPVGLDGIDYSGTLGDISGSQTLFSLASEEETRAAIDEIFSD